MPEFVSVYADESSNTVVSVSAAFAESAGLTVLKEPALDHRGKPLPPREGHRTSAKKAANSTTSTTGGSSASKPEEGSL